MKIREMVRNKPALLEPEEINGIVKIYHGSV